MKRKKHKYTISEETETIILAQINSNSKVSTGETSNSGCCHFHNTVQTIYKSINITSI